MGKIHKYIIAIVLYLLGTVHGFAQASNFENIGIAQGLSQGMVGDLIQDKNGFIWFTTKDGLNRYDGYNFKVFTHNPYNKYSISGNSCTFLLLDSKGHLWIGTEKDGLNLYDSKTQRFYHANITDSKVNKTENYRISYIEEDSSHNIYVYVSTNEQFYTIKSFNQFPTSENFTNLIKKTANTASLKSNRYMGVYMYLPYKIFLKANPSFTTDYPAFGPGKISYYVLKDYNNWYWIYNGQHLYCLENKHVTEIKCDKNCQPCYGFNLADSAIILANYNNIWKFKPKELLKNKTMTMENRYVQAPTAMQFCNNIISDQYQNLWIATSGYGAEKLNPTFLKFHSYMQGFTLYELHQHPNGKIFAEANYRPTNHLYEIDKLKNSFLPNEKIRLKNNMHLAMSIDKDGNYWILHFAIFDHNITLIKYNEDQKELKKYSFANGKACSLLPTQMKFDASGKLWISSLQGSIYCFDTQKETFEQFKYTNISSTSQVEFGTNFIYFDKQQTLWICTESGLIKMINYDTKPSFVIFKNNTQNTSSLSNNNASSCIDDPRNNNYLWITTKGGGLERLHKTTSVFEHYTTEQGLPNNVVYGVLKGNDGNLWMSTNRGIAKLNLDKMVFTNYNKSDGLQDNEFNSFSFAYGNNDNLLFGGVNGLTIFNPQDLVQTTVKPLAQVIDLKINNITINPLDKTEILTQAIEFTDKIELKFNQNQIGIEMALMDLSNPSKNKFQYQLEGIDKDWVQSGTNRFANYAQLPSGNYTFKMMATANGEVWSDVVTLKIKINPPFYRTWWAYLLYALVCALLGYNWYRNQLKKVRLQEQVIYKEKEAKQLADLDVIKTNFFSNISHEIRTPLTLILAPAEHLIKQNPSEIMNQLIFRNAKRILELINQILDISKLDAGQMKLITQEKELVAYFNNCLNNFATIAQSKKIDYAYTQNMQSAIGWIDDDKVNKIINNLLSNAIKFTDAGGKINITIEYNEAISLVKINVIDTGFGIAPDKISTIFNRYFQTDHAGKGKFQGTGIGLALVKELIELMKGKITVSSEEGIGSNFMIEIPINDNKNQ